MRLSLLAHAMRRGVWLLGFGFMICSFLLQAFALHIGRLSVVQPILTMELLFLVAILGHLLPFLHLGPRVGRRRRHRLRALGLPLLRRTRRRRRGADQPGLDRGRRRQHVPHRASPSSPPGGARAGGRRRCSGARPPSPTPSRPPSSRRSATTPPPTGSPCSSTGRPTASSSSGCSGLFLTQNAFHAGPLAASQSTLVLVDPLVSICLGIALYGDSLRTAGPTGPLEALSLLVDVHGRGLPLQLAADHRHEERGQGRRVRRDALPPAQAPPPRPTPVAQPLT